MFYLGLVVMCTLMVSCGGLKKARQERLILQGNLDTLPNLTVLPKVAQIQKGDLLSISIYSRNPELAALFNQRMQTASGGDKAATGTGAAPGSASGYLVDNNGNIFIPVLGLIKADGLSRLEFMDSLNKRLEEYIKEPYTDVRFLNFKVTAIGEVGKPGTFTIPNEKLTVLELLGLAGDLTIYGKRDNILIIREQDGKRAFGRINLKDPSVFQSPYFYLQQNDVVMVEPLPSKPTSDEQANTRKLTYASIAVSLLSVTAIIINIFR